MSIYQVSYIFTKRKEHKMKTKNSKFSRILVVLMIVLLMIPALGSAAYAESEEDSAQTMTVNSYAISFVARNNVVGDADVYAHSLGLASTITSKITLQSAPLGSSSYSNVSGVLPSTLTVYNTVAITHLCSFPISSSKNYRIKIQITDTVNGKTSTTTLYKTLSR